MSFHSRDIDLYSSIVSYVIAPTEVNHLIMLILLIFQLFLSCFAVNISDMVNGFMFISSLGDELCFLCSYLIRRGFE